ncbi:hypothetical protein [Neoaquamicrobium sediminum]|uniref:hypothetical protein n=1 Tax=Neoaquamicrobium sediminum TaxID=1849104 RepID=UPI001564F2D3|nr:hypothetical protein [Mesorhizobium sediminum]NRC55066.1 hypothetical protein [Mesorhizobium sediminum]
MLVLPVGEQPVGLGDLGEAPVDVGGTEHEGPREDLAGIECLEVPSDLLGESWVGLKVDRHGLLEDHKFVASRKPSQGIAMAGCLVAVGTTVAGDTGAIAGTAGALAGLGFVEGLAALKLGRVIGGLGSYAPVAWSAPRDGRCHEVSMGWW